MALKLPTDCCIPQSIYPPSPLLCLGAVLGAFSVLKEDTFPGMMSGKVPQAIDGAPNFRYFEGNQPLGDRAMW